MFNSIKNKFFEEYYFLKAENLLRETSFLDLLNIIKENEVKVSTLTPKSEDDWLYFYTKKNENYILYYKQIRIIIQNSNDKIVRFSILKPGCKWEFDEKGEDNSNTFEVYARYDIEDIIGDRCIGGRYLKGNWNKYVYETTKQLIDKINSWTYYNIFNNAFKNNG